jgi:hypothetical protein
MSYRWSFELALTACVVERRQPRRDLYLDIDGAGLDALKRHRRDPLHHGQPLLWGSG